MPIVLNLLIDLLNLNKYNTQVGLNTVFTIVTPDYVFLPGSFLLNVHPP